MIKNVAPNFTTPFLAGRFCHVAIARTLAKLARRFGAVVPTTLLANTFKLEGDAGDAGDAEQLQCYTGSRYTMMVRMNQYSKLRCLGQ